MDEVRKSNKVKREDNMSELLKQCHKFYYYKSKPDFLYFGDIENINFIIAIMVIICLLNIYNYRKT